MLLYWGMFTVGFLAGSILAFVTFAAKKPEDDPEYENPRAKTALDNYILLTNRPRTDLIQNPVLQGKTEPNTIKTKKYKTAVNFNSN